MAKEKCTAKRKYEDEHRAFLTEWESLHFFVECNSKPFCLICQALLAHFKASNLQRHFRSLHANISRKFPKGTELRKHKLITLKSQADTGFPKIHEALRDCNACTVSNGLEYCNGQKDIQ